MLDATPLLRLRSARRLRRLARLDPVETQRTQLRRLLRRARATRFGREHGFGEIDGVAAFQRRVPIRRYEDFWTAYWAASFPVLEDITWPGRIPYFAATSGTTTGVTKYIPVSWEMVHSNTSCALDVLAYHLHQRPESRVLAGKNLMLGGSVDLTRKAPGVHVGDLTGIAMREVPLWARPYVFPPRSLELPADWERKIEQLARLSVLQDIRIVAGTASWLLLFFAKLDELRPSRGRGLVRHYPELEMITHGGVSFAPYRKQFEALLAGSRAELREVYPASEGFIAAADRGTGEGLRLNIDQGIFYEFVPVEELDAREPTRLWLQDVEFDRNYAVVLSNCAGLWAYLLGDTVKFVDLNPPRLLVTGRTSYALSAFGEHLIGEEIEQAVAEASDAIGCSVTDYSVGAVFPEGRAPGGHLFIVEFAEGEPDRASIERFAGILDRALAVRNADYREHRHGDFGMAPPRVVAAPPGTFAAWMRKRGKLGGQNKVPRVLHDAEMLADLAAACGNPLGR